MNTPISEMYVYRSAMEWLPTWTSPIIGISVKMYHATPTAIHGRARTLRKATVATAPRTPIAIATIVHGTSAGYG